MDFRNFALGELNWRESPNETGEDFDFFDENKVYKGRQEVTYRGGNMVLTGTHVKHFNRTEDGSLILKREEINFTLGNLAEYVEADISIIGDDQKGAIEDAIIKRRLGMDGDPIPAGAGMVLYEKMLDFIQHLADTRGVVYRHLCERMPTYSSTPISIERWNELFLPILEKREYQGSVKDGEWRKTYYPHGIAESDLKAAT